MSTEARRRAYLEAMGIPLWRDARADRLDTGGKSGVEDAGSEAPGVEKTGVDNPGIEASAPQADSAGPASEPPAPDESDDAAIATLDWEALEARVADCTRCPLHRDRTQGVFGVGNRQADWLFIGEAPGAEEDRRGEPFVGRAGQLLDSILAAAGHSRESVYIANIIKSRPPRNRDPEPEEVAACLPYLRRQIELIRPRIVVLVGRVSAQTLLETSAPVGRLRGQVHRLPGFGIPAVVTYHPAYLLRSPLEKRKVWEDFRLARRSLEASS